MPIAPKRAPLAITLLRVALGVICQFKVGDGRHALVSSRPVATLFPGFAKEERT